MFWLFHHSLVLTFEAKKHNRDFYSQIYYDCSTNLTFYVENEGILFYLISHRNFLSHQLTVLNFVNVYYFMQTHTQEKGLFTIINNYTMQEKIC